MHHFRFFGRPVGAEASGQVTPSSCEVSDHSQATTGVFEIDLAVIQDQSRKFVPGKTIVDFSLSLSDGRALPDTVSVCGSGKLRVRESPHQGGDILLSMTLVYADGDMERFDLGIDATTRPLRLHMTQTGPARAPALFSDALFQDEASAAHTHADAA